MQCALEKTVMLEVMQSVAFQLLKTYLHKAYADKRPILRGSHNLSVMWFCEITR